MSGALEARTLSRQIDGSPLGEEAQRRGSRSLQHGDSTGGITDGHSLQKSASLRGQELSVSIICSVADTPRLTEGPEPGFEYALDDDDADGPLDCDCPASCQRGTRGYRLGCWLG